MWSGLRGNSVNCVYIVVNIKNNFIYVFKRGIKGMSVDCVIIWKVEVRFWIICLRLCRCLRCKGFFIYYRRNNDDSGLVL